MPQRRVMDRIDLLHGALTAVAFKASPAWSKPHQGPDHPPPPPPPPPTSPPPSLHPHFAPPSQALAVATSPRHPVNSQPAPAPQGEGLVC